MATRFSVNASQEGGAGWREIGGGGREGMALFLVIIVTTCVVTHLVHTINNTYYTKTYLLPYCTLGIPPVQHCPFSLPHASPYICSGQLKFIKDSVQV